MFSALMVPSQVAFGLSTAPNTTSARVSRVREIVASVHVLGQGTRMSVSGSTSAVQEVCAVRLGAMERVVAPVNLDWSTTTVLSYSTKQPATTGAFIGARPGVRSWSPPD